ncbi:MAG: type II toxin-antitoxin system VapC family toxin [Haloferacaceae archaeon]
MDSSFVVDFLDSETDHHEDAVEWMHDHGDEAFAVPAICAFEVLRGTARVGDERFDRAVGFLRSLDVLDFDLGVAIAAGELDSRLHARGTPLGARDTLVATPALEHGYALVTRDRDFDVVPDLDVVFYDA